MMIPSINNNQNNQNNNLFLKPINNYSINEENSYINSVLQCLIRLDCLYNWIKLLNKYQVMNNFEACITKEFYQLFIGLYSNQQQIDSTNIIFHYKNKMNSLYNKEVTKDPYHFLFYFLELLHCENNSPVNQNFDINQYKNNIKNSFNQKDNNIMLNLYCNYFSQTQNSVISDHFFTTEKYSFKCNICLESFYYYDYIKIFCFNLDKFKTYKAQQNLLNVSNQPLNLDECFYYYEKDDNTKCNKCNHCNAFNSRNIFTSTTVLLISFKRNYHNYKGDIKFDLNFSIYNYVLEKNISNTKYILKAIISGYSFNNKITYFVDIRINNDWYRFLDNTFKKLKRIQDLYEYEPQILIYELSSKQSNNSNANFVNPFYKQVNQIKNNNFIIPNQLQLMQLRMEQLKMIQAMKIMNMMKLVQQNFMFMQFNHQANNNNINSPNIFLKFLIIPELWDNSEENSITIKPQVTPEDTIETAINNFFVKLQKPREAITKFLYNNVQIDPNSQVKLKDYGLNNESTIYAIRSYNFDELRCV